MPTFIGIGGQELIFVLLFAGAFLLLPLIALIDVVRSEFQGPNDKLIWVIIIVFLNIIGAILYFAIGRNQRIP
ncbi:PLDc N-terminal domain-containing protein [Spirosoma koreense]